MVAKTIDLRSDTVTQPDAAMRRAMADAQVGDDVYGEDPSVNRLEERIADLLGKEDAIFVPSGTMANQIAVRVHTRPGDEVLCEQWAHLYLYEGGGPAQLSGVTCRAIAGERGILDVSDFEGMIQNEDVHRPRTRMVAIENTHNRGGGAVYPVENIQRICAWAKKNGLATHLDGARLMNATVASGNSPDQWTSHFDTVSFCFSKGLGAPVGSALAGTKEIIHDARRVRKVLGGGMRQAGVLAAACLYALEHNVNRLAEDHANAKILAEALEQTDGFRVRAADIETNLVWFDVDPSLGTARGIAERFRGRQILVGALGAQLMRVCTHLNINREDVTHVAHLIPEFARK